MRSANIKRADAAVAFGQWVGVCCGLVLAFMALGYLMLVGDEREQAALAAEHESQEIEYQHRERSSWADHPNLSHCGWSCINRIGDGRE